MRIIYTLCLLAAAAIAGAERHATPGTLIRADGSEEPAKTRCLKSCAEWGENCITDHRGSSRCYRVCKRFGEECFEEKEKEQE